MFFDRYSRRRRWIVGFVAVTTAVVIMLLTPPPKMVSGEFKMESTRKLSNFDIQWTNTLYQNNLKHIAFFFTFVKNWRCNVKFHKKCENTGKILKISCVRSNFVKFNIHFLGLPWEIYYRWLIISSALEECNILSIILLQGFCPLKIKITQFPDGFRLKLHVHGKWQTSDSTWRISQNRKWDKKSSKQFLWIKNCLKPLIYV